MPNNKEKDLVNYKYRINIKNLILNIVLTTLALYLIIGTAFTGGLKSLSLVDILLEVTVDIFIELIVLKDMIYLKIMLICLIIAIIINTLNEIKNAIKFNRHPKL